LLVYPNPTRDIFTIKFFNESAEVLNVRVINILGELIYSESHSNHSGDYSKVITLKNNTKGIYFVEIEINNKIIREKLILQ
jgi:hypothetical protein